jgi:hypothetical protein
MVNAMDSNRAVTQNPQPKRQHGLDFRQRNGERRKQPAKGFTYISMVGWVCRREQIRRKDDKMNSS